jgi:hypothetical protein
VSSENVTMDPNATLVEIRTLVAIGLSEDLDPADTHRLLMLVEALDDWLTGGGFLPTNWARRLPDAPRGDGSPQPCWQVRPSELACRYGCNSYQLCDDINPEDLSDWQISLVLAAIDVADERMARMRIPEE